MRRLASALLGRFHAVRQRRLTVRERWEHRLHTEVRFWRGFLADPERVGRWKSLRAREVWSEAGLDWVADLLPPGRVSVVDVGAGPMTSVPDALGDRHLEVTAIDPLADAYEPLLRENGIVPRVASRPGTGERLLEHVEPGSFDMAYASNSLDHGHDPVLSVRNMVLAVKPGGTVVLRHKHNEGRKAHYRGLHQWNFDAEAGELILWRPGERRNLSRELAPLASGRAEVRDAWTTWVGRRHPS